MKISKEFSKHALSYDSLNDIQNLVAHKLVSMIDSEPKNILDLGCGSGGVCKEVDWDYSSFLGIDFAQGMLDLHPKSNKIEALYGDFNDVSFLSLIQKNKYDFIFSSSSLQWAKDLESLFEKISAYNIPIAFAIFTSNTFKTLNQIASLDSLLRTTQEIKILQEKYFDADFEVIEYKLEFDTVREMFRYIKKSGVSGSRKVLNYKETKSLMKNYPLNYLEFEVAFIKSR